MTPKNRWAFAAAIGLAGGSILLWLYALVVLCTVREVCL